MAHDRYEMDILKQLSRIANYLEKIEKKLPKVQIMDEESINDKDILYNLEDDRKWLD